MWQSGGVRPVLRSLWLSYLGAERDGYRPRSLTALSELLDAVTSVEDRDAVAQVAFRTNHPRLRLREPLRARVLRPYVREHFSEPHVIWWAMDTQTADDEALKVYGRYDRVGGNAVAGAITYALAVTGEPRWWRRLLDHRLAAVEHGTHHLDEGRGVVDGKVIDYVLQVCAAVAIADQAPAGVIGADRRDELVEMWSLLRDWVRYDAAGRPGEDFPRWCRHQGSDHWVAHHSATRHHYYRATTKHKPLAQAER